MYSDRDTIAHAAVARAPSFFACFCYMIILYDKYIYQRRFFPILFLFPFSSSIEKTVFDHISKDMKFVKNAPLRIVFSILFSSFREFYVTYQTRKTERSFYYICLF